MSYIYHPFSRRSFIQGLSGLVAAPFLSSLAPKEALAAVTNSQRFVAIATPSQLPAMAMSPVGYAKVLPPNLAAFTANLSDGIYPYREMDLAAVSAAAGGNFSPILDSKYNPYLSKIAVLRGLDMPGRVDHGAATGLGNIAASHMGQEKGYKAIRTMDEFLIYSDNFYTEGKMVYRFPVIRIGERSISTSQIGGINGIGISGSNAGLTMNGNLSEIFEYGFSNQTSGIAKATIVDNIRLNVNSIKSAGKISGDDIHVLNQFMDLMNDLQKGLRNSIVLPSKPPVTLTTVHDSSLGDTSDPINNTVNYYQDAAKLIVLALQCGLTKVVTLGVNSALLKSNQVITHSGGVREWHLNLAHGNDGAGLTAVNKFITDKVFFEVIRGLDTMESGGGKYIDNTLIYFKSEMSVGHSGVNYGALVAGNANGGLKLGKLYDYSNWSHPSALNWNQGAIVEPMAPGQPINRLWIGMMHSLGLIPTDYQGRFGNGSKGFGIWEDYNRGWESFFAGIQRDAKVSDSLAGLFSK